MAWKTTIQRIIPGSQGPRVPWSAPWVPVHLHAVPEVVSARIPVPSGFTYEEKLSCGGKETPQVGDDPFYR